MWSLSLGWKSRVDLDQFVVWERDGIRIYSDPRLTRKRCQHTHTYTNTHKYTVHTQTWQTQAQ